MLATQEDTLRVDVLHTVLQSASLDVFNVIVSADDVTRGKPDPEGYLLALDRLGVPLDGAIAIEDSPPGVTAAKAAGLRCVAVLGTAPPERLGEADDIVARLDVALVDRLLAG